MQAANGDVVLEQDNAGNRYLHLILPADRINFLHGAQGSGSFFNHESGFGFDDDLSGSAEKDKMLIEVGCKVYEVNRVAYRN